MRNTFWRKQVWVSALVGFDHGIVLSTEQSVSKPVHGRF
ncbi:Unknown protein sequence [Pseudomonas amygdali pv. lachrymans]|uniref:Uncharacterized protein n=1 Tax=Pseudomonas amygdali pv. lachrymans TaxID=53707 RepID=A0ABR5KR09_PSEAV|nr:Unknown protein sequence [Pseudomonas amygdali pv. lachrymans]KPC18037.1 Unknown protein sequence [Pseudomonas amygdali pv. lachrymans]RMT06202.1 hypothetical protein ALP54_102786 [Pseudomonas amygdali pv. lachrymans]